jgi:hypothetical protein
MSTVLKVLASKVLLQIGVRVLSEVPDTMFPIN